MHDMKIGTHAPCSYLSGMYTKSSMTGTIGHINQCVIELNDFIPFNHILNVGS